MSQRFKSNQFPRPFTLEIDGLPVLTFQAINMWDAKSLRHEQWLQDDLRNTYSNGMPLWDGQASLSVRQANDEEVARFNEGMLADAAPPDELMLVYLIPRDV